MSKSIFQKVLELSAINRILSTYIFSHMVSFSENETTQVDVDTFVTCLAKPENPKGNILIIQGGVCHNDFDSYYVRTAAYLMTIDKTQSSRIFLFLKQRPVISHRHTKDLAKVIAYIKREYPGPLVIIGYSMGGLLLLFYLAMGYDQADFYIPTCCTLDLERFNYAINNNEIFKIAISRGYKNFGVGSKQELFELAGTNEEEHEQFSKTFLNKLNRHVNKWIHRLAFVIGSDDPITEGYNEWIKTLRGDPTMYVVQGGWHCCLDTIYLTVDLSKQQLSALEINV